MRAIVTRVERQAGGVTIVGRFAGASESLFVMTRVDDAVSGYFLAGDGRGARRLRYGGPDGTHYLHANDPARMAPCAAGPARPQPADAAAQVEALLRALGILDAPAPTAALPGSRPPADSVLGCLPGQPTFDVMVVYSDDARAAAGGTAAIRAEAINAVEVMEETYVLCLSIFGELIHTNIVYLAEVSYDESGSYQDHLNRLIDPDDGILDGVHGTRDVVSADFVSLLVNDTDAGGLAPCEADEDEAFSVVRWAQAELSLAHEIGHNIGCAHNPESADCEPTDYGYGHNFFVPDLGVNRRTVMAYALLPGDDRLPYYSSPVVEYHGVFTGTPDRDNVRVIRERRLTCQGFRHTRMKAWVDFGYGGSETGSFDQPFNTVAEGANRLLEDPPGGPPTLHLRAGSSPEAVTISKAMMIETCGGVVTIGQ